MSETAIPMPEAPVAARRAPGRPAKYLTPEEAYTAQRECNQRSRAKRGHIMKKDRPFGNYKVTEPRPYKGLKYASLEEYHVARQAQKHASWLRSSERKKAAKLASTDGPAATENPMVG